MKIIVEMDEFGRVRIDSDEKQIDVAQANFLLDLGKMTLVNEWAHTLEPASTFEPAPTEEAEREAEAHVFKVDPDE